MHTCAVALHFMLNTAISIKLANFERGVRSVHAHIVNRVTLESGLRS